jgi:photosystem II stability/assembly factor-like uncharacterized protein
VPVGVIFLAGDVDVCVAVFHDSPARGFCLGHKGLLIEIGEDGPILGAQAHVGLGGGRDAHLDFSVHRGEGKGLAFGHLDECRVDLAIHRFDQGRTRYPVQRDFAVEAADFDVAFDVPDIRAAAERVFD